MNVSIRPYGERAALVDVDSAVQGAALADWARATGVVAEEIVPAARTVLFDGVDIDSLARLLEGWHASSAPARGALVEVPVVFDGPDLDDVASRWGVTADDVVARMTGVEWCSAFCGFAPGFAYLAGLPSELAVPRLSTPRSRVDAGSVAVAGEWCGIYPSASPGGWRIVGHTEVTLWDVDRDPPALLAPGTRVRLVRI